MTTTHIAPQHTGTTTEETQHATGAGRGAEVTSPLAAASLPNRWETAIDTIMRSAAEHEPYTPKVGLSNSTTQIGNTTITIEFLAA